MRRRSLSPRSRLLVGARCTVVVYSESTSSDSRVELCAALCARLQRLALAFLRLIEWSWERVRLRALLSSRDKLNRRRNQLVGHSSSRESELEMSGRRSAAAAAKPAAIYRRGKPAVEGRPPEDDSDASDDDGDAGQAAIAAAPKLVSIQDKRLEGFTIRDDPTPAPPTLDLKLKAPKREISGKCRSGKVD